MLRDVKPLVSKVVLVDSMEVVSNVFVHNM